MYYLPRNNFSLFFSLPFSPFFFSFSFFVDSTHKSGCVRVAHSAQQPFSSDLASCYRFMNVSLHLEDGLQKPRWLLVRRKCVNSVKACFMALCIAQEKHFSLGNNFLLNKAVQKFLCFLQVFIDVVAIVIKFLGIADYSDGIEPKSLLFLAEKEKKTA